MSTSSDGPGIALAKELRRESEQGRPAVTPMDAVTDAARRSKLWDDQCFKASRSSVDKRLMYYVYGGWAQGINLNEYPPAVAYLFGKQIYDESTHEISLPLGYSQRVGTKEAHVTVEEVQFLIDLVRASAKVDRPAIREQVVTPVLSRGRAEIWD
jgi:hypothetical protein